ncbi:hypothetical protein BGW41_007116 [Actinomortierella wolfii]|nr:hypothetical protein BGW41_007116 [Actinomortierella wolfii]
MTYSYTSSSLPIQHPRGASVPPPTYGQSSFQTGTAASSSLSTSSFHHSYVPYPYGTGIECFASLQSLEYEPEPLLTEKTIHGIIHAGKTVVLTREYSPSSATVRESRLFAAARRHGRTGFKEDENDVNHNDDDDGDHNNDDHDPEVIEQQTQERQQGPDKVTPAQHFDSRDEIKRSAHDFPLSLNKWDSEGSYFPPMDPTVPSVDYDSLNIAPMVPKTGYTDYVQGLNPTWSQSPAPSPNIMKEDPTINPFFQPLSSYPTMDDDTFDPPESTPDVTDDGNSSASDCQSSFDKHVRPLPRIQPPVPDNLRSLIHIPLYRSSDQNKQRFLPSDIQRTRPPTVPVGILSIMSDQTPYPPEALDVLMELNPFLANQITNALRLEDHFAGSRRWGGSRSQLDSGFRSGPGSSLGDKLDRSGHDGYASSHSTSSLSLSLRQQGQGIARHNPPASTSSIYQSDGGHTSGSMSQQLPGSRRRETQQQRKGSGEIPAEDLIETPRPLGNDQRNDGNAQEQRMQESQQNQQQYFDRPVGQSGQGHDGSSLESSTTPTGTPAADHSHGQSNEAVTKNGTAGKGYEESQAESGQSPARKGLETLYNLDTRTDEIHRNLNILSLDVTGGATCPLAPRSKKMLMVGRQTGSKAAMLKSPAAAQFKDIEDSLQTSWTSSRKRAETSPLLPEDGSDSEDMWQTLSTSEDTGLNKSSDSGIKSFRRDSGAASSYPGRSGHMGDVDSLGSSHESPYFASVMPSISPSNSTKRHFFSTGKRSGVRRRRKSIKDIQRLHASSSTTGTHGSSTHSNANDSSVPPSPLTPGAGSDISSSSHIYGHRLPPERPLSATGSVSECGYLSNDQLTFSPGASPSVSPTPHDPDRLDPSRYHIKSDIQHQRKGSTGTATSRDGSVPRKASLSRHGSGWSINSDETASVTSPGWATNNDRSQSAPRKSRSKKNHHHAYSYHFHHHHHYFASNERAGYNHFPRTQLLRLIVDAIAHHVFTLSPTTATLTWVNQRALQYTGISQSQLVHSPWTICLHEDDQATIGPLFKECFDKGEIFNAQYRVRRFDGQYRWFLGRFLPVRDYGGSIVHWFGTSTDIHDQKLAELQLNRQIELELSEKKYRLLAEAIPQIVFTATPHVGLTYANAKWYTYSGQIYEQAYGLGFLDQVHPEDRAKCFLPNIIAEDNDGPFPRPANFDFGDTNSEDTNSSTRKGSETPTGSANLKSPGYRHSTSPGGVFGQSPGDVSYQTEIRLKRKDGKFRWFLVKCISVEDGEQGRKWFGTCTDINDQKMLEHKLKEAHDAAQKSTESKTRFLSNMSHEIRTPLVGITGMINFLITTDLTSEQLDYVHTVQQSADALLLVINDILDLSKVEAGMMKLEMEPFSVHAMIEDANELLNTLAIQKGLELGFLVENEVPEVVIGDRVRLRQVLLNIIGNAIKFTSKGEVFSRCSVVKTSPQPPATPTASHSKSGGASATSSSSSPTSGTPALEPNEIMIKFEISDTGKGFDQTERMVMFKPFSQVDTSSTRKHGGTGLGLVLSKEFVELHGGTITCESEKNKGSKFSFTFKAKIPPPNVIPRATTPISDENQKTISYQYSAPQSAVGFSDESRSMTPTLSESGKTAMGVAVGSSNQSSPVKPQKIHVSGVRLAPGEVCLPEQDRETALENAKRILESRTDKVRETALMHGIDPDASRRHAERAGSSARRLSHSRGADKPATAAAAAAIGASRGTPMSRAESLLEERHNKLGLSSPNPPLGEPPSVAVIAANLPNPADEMTLRLPNRVKEAKALRKQKQQEQQLAQSLGEMAGESMSGNMNDGRGDGGGARPSIGSQDSTGSSTHSTMSALSTDDLMSTAPSSTDSLTTMRDLKFTRPRMLVIAEFEHAVETILHLIPKLAPSESFEPTVHVTRSVKEGCSWLLGEEEEDDDDENEDNRSGNYSATTTKQSVAAQPKQPYNFVIISLTKYMEVLDLFAVMRQEGAQVAPDAMTCVITTPIQRAALIEAIKAEEAQLEITRTVDTPKSQQQVIPDKVEWVFKPLTRNKLAVAFEELIEYHEKLHYQSHPPSQAGGGEGSGEPSNTSGFDYHGVPVRFSGHHTDHAPSGLPSKSDGSMSASSSTVGLNDSSSGVGVGYVSRSQTNSPANNSSSNGGTCGSGKLSLKRQTAQQVVMDQKEIFTQMQQDLAASGKTIRILLAEDNLVNQKVLQRYFQMIGADLIIANDGNECVRIFEEKGPGFFDLVLCDLFMPGKDGYEATRAIREWEEHYVSSLASAASAASQGETEHGEHKEQQRNAKYSPIPIVALSANVMANVAEQCLNSGFTSYLSKPVDFRQLSDTIRYLVL